MLLVWGTPQSAENGSQSSSGKRQDSTASVFIFTQGTASILQELGFGAKNFHHPVILLLRSLWAASCEHDESDLASHFRALAAPAQVCGEAG